MSHKHIMLHNTLLTSYFKYSKMHNLPFDLWDGIEFNQPHHVLDNQMKILTKAGLGQTVKHVQPLLFEDELIL